MVIGAGLVGTSECPSMQVTHGWTRTLLFHWGPHPANQCWGHTRAIRLSIQTLCTEVSSGAVGRPVLGDSPLNPMQVRSPLWAMFSRLGTCLRETPWVTTMHTKVCYCLFLGDTTMWTPAWEHVGTATPFSLPSPCTHTTPFLGGQVQVERDLP